MNSGLYLKKPPETIFFILLGYSNETTEKISENVGRKFVRTISAGNWYHNTALYASDKRNSPRWWGFLEQIT